jgi:hypothetical protein
MKKFETIKALYETVKAGDIKEEKLNIILDNDQTSFILETGIEGGEEIEIPEANGYRDVDKLYKILFPKAFVDWC